ncbi:MAG: regulatory protein RecX [Gammaproteobacteria bacterium]|jgi:regulatory protein|nr:regulatory protein RecX [Gammaproteobacteria bacterium]
MNPIKTKAIDYLSRREHSVKELQAKLEQHFTDTDQIKEALEALQTEGYLSNSRFLESRIRHRLNQGYGRIRITQELSHLHGFKSTDIQAGFVLFAELNDEGNQLSQFIKKKYPHFDPENKLEIQKITKKLLQRGFDYASIKDALRSAHSTPKQC